MKKQLFWFWLCLKRQFTKPVFWIQLLLLPCAAVLAAGASEKDPGILKIALAVEGSGNGEAERAAALLLEQEGPLRFYRCDDGAQVTADVEARRAECGFVFEEAFSAGLADGALNRTIRLVQSPSTVAGELATESVSAAVMLLVGPDALQGLVSQPFFQEAVRTETGGQLEELYHTFLANDSTFSFVYETVDGQAADPGQWERQVFPVRGLGAVFLWAAALFAAAAVKKDQESGVYGCMPPGQRPLGVLLSVSAPVAPVAAVCLLSVALSGAWTTWGKELTAMMLFCAGAVLTAALLRRLIRRETILWAVMLFLLAGSLVLCPVAVNLGRLIPAAGILQRLFLPYYYLSFF